MPCKLFWVVISASAIEWAVVALVVEIADGAAIFAVDVGGAGEDEVDEEVEVDEVVVTVVTPAEIDEDAAGDEEDDGEGDDVACCCC